MTTCIKDIIVLINTVQVKIAQQVFLIYMELTFSSSCVERIKNHKYLNGQNLSSRSLVLINQNNYYQCCCTQIWEDIKSTREMQKLQQAFSCCYNNCCEALPLQLEHYNFQHLFYKKLTNIYIHLNIYKHLYVYLHIIVIIQNQ